MPSIKITPLGAGQDVGRSCILLTIGGRNIMLDCGIHLKYEDERRFPDFSYIAKGALTTKHLACVIISHAHLDHCGALPYLTEVWGYNGPIYMTTPTKAICSILLEDCQRFAMNTERAQLCSYDPDMIKSCMKKVKTVSLRETVKVVDELEIKAYYAGHVLGAAMFQIRVGADSVVYTGDFSMNPDHYLKAANIDRCRPNVLITESTYATTVRESRLCREKEFLKKVMTCVNNNGKVLIPSPAVGRVQELCILLDTYWENNNLKVPIYFSPGLSKQVMDFCKTFITWTNQNPYHALKGHNMFDFKHIKAFEQVDLDAPGPMVIFSTPGSIQFGTSAKLLKKWSQDENNMLIMPGSCLSDAIREIPSQNLKLLKLENGETMQIKIATEFLTLSSHADAKGIMHLIKCCAPEKVMLVHGESKKMDFLKGKILTEAGLECFIPANGETVTIPTKVLIPIDCSLKLLKRQIKEQGGLDGKEYIPLHGVLMMKDGKVKLLDAKDAMTEVGIEPHTFSINTYIEVDDLSDSSPEDVAHSIYRMIKRDVEDAQEYVCSFQCSEDSVSYKTISIKVENLQKFTKKILLSWNHEDSELGLHLLELLKNSSSSYMN